ncbi:MAG: DDE-type integrase/transposase/recombinase [Methylocella sp.]
MRRRFRVRATDSRHDLPLAPDLLEQTFVAARPHQVWLAGVPSVPTAEGWLYLVVALDLFTRKIVGWSMRDHRRAIAALSMAIKRHRPAPGLIRHSDRGSQYAAADDRKVYARRRVLFNPRQKAPWKAESEPGLGNARWWGR